MRHAEKVKPKIIYIDTPKSDSRGGTGFLVCQLALIYVTLVGFIYCVSTSLKMPFGIAAVALLCLPFVILFGLFSASEKLYLPFACTVGGIALFAFVAISQLRRAVISSFVFCYNLTIKLVVDEGYTDYIGAMTEDITEKLSDSVYVTGSFLCVIITLILLFSFIFSQTLIRRSLVWAAVIPCFLVLTPSLYFGSVPSGPAFCIFLSGIIGCYVQSLSAPSRAVRGGGFFKNVRSRLRGCAPNGLFCMLCALCLSLSVSAVIYSEDIVKIDSVREILDNISTQIMNRLFYEKYETPEGAVGGLLDGDILELKTPEFRGLPVMDVTTRTNSSLYLRGWIGKDLQKTGWKVLNDNDTRQYRDAVGGDFNEYTQLYDFAKLMWYKPDNNATAEQTRQYGFVLDTVSVKAHFTKSLMLFLPVSGSSGEIEGSYRGITDIGDTIRFFSDGRPGSNRYSAQSALIDLSDRAFYLGFKQKLGEYLTLAEGSPDGFTESERAYRRYVDSAYKALPDGADFLRELAKEQTTDYSSDFDRALAIERYFKENYSYARNFTTTEGSALEKIEYMITKSKTGYCTYFATAMTLMMRTLDIPARYVTGYHAMIVPDSGKSKYERNIKDSEYHAWVEVYIDGIGWITFDPTPGVGGSQSIRDYDYLDDPAEQPETEEQAPAAPTEPEPVLPESGPTPANPAYPDTPLPRWAVALIICLALLALVAGAAVAFCIIVKKRFAKFRAELETLPPRACVSRAYRAILRLLGSLRYLPACGETLKAYAERVDTAFNTGITLGSILETLEMSQFSQNPISVLAAARVLEYYDELSQIVLYSHNIFKRYYCMATITKRML